MKRTHHWFGLLGAIALGAALRFWQLESKPLWLDEVLTALFSLGHHLASLPLDRLLSLADVTAIFQLQPGTTCGQIAQHLLTESTHPPLFFCLMHRWMQGLLGVGVPWVWALRSLPALLGVGAIAALYGLNRVAFSPRAALLGAWVMAVSPFAVYLSQEGRHYTLPMLLVTLALTLLVSLQRDLRHQRDRPWRWLAWVAVNALGLYVHYFFLLAIAAQVGVLLGLAGLYRRGWRTWIAIALAVAGIGLAYGPAWPSFWLHFQRPETNWLTLANPVAPLYQTLLGWVWTVVALPVEEQPLGQIVVSALLMLGAIAWLGYWLIQGARHAWQTSGDRATIAVLAGFLGLMTLEFWAIAYGLNKDLTAIPRYNFVYYPALASLLGLCLAAPFPRPRVSPALGAIALGVASSLLVSANWVFLKPYLPDRVAQHWQQFPDRPLVVALAYQDLQEVALGLSFGLALSEGDRSAASPPTQLAFFSRVRGYEPIWRNLSRLDAPSQSDLWIVGPGLKQSQFPPALELQSQGQPLQCTLDPTNYYRIGVPYQRYQCP